jgi:small ubiquitin-related modifier
VTIIYCPGDKHLLNKQGQSIELGDNEVAVCLGAAVQAALTPPGENMSSLFPSTPHGLAAVACDERFSVVFRARGHAGSVLDPARFLPPYLLSSSSSSGLSSSSFPMAGGKTLSQFYAEFKATHRSVNELPPAPVPTTSGAAPVPASQQAYSANDAITIKFRSQSGSETFFKVKRGTIMIKAMAAYAERSGVPLASFRFTVDGGTVLPFDTPKMLELEDGDQIDVLLQQCGD